MSGGVSSYDRSNRQNTGHQFTEAGLGSSVGADARVSAMRAGLTAAGFSKEEIAKIAEKVPDLNVKILQPSAGDSIQRTSTDAVHLVSEVRCPVVFKFNGSLLVVKEGDTAESICAAEQNALEARMNALLAAHMKTLETLDFKDPVAPLKWLCTLEHVGGWTYARYDRGEVIKAFKEAGYTPNMNLGDKCKPEDQANMKGYIIGQALAGIESEYLGCPLPAIHAVTGEYKRFFSLE